MSEDATVMTWIALVVLGMCFIVTIINKNGIENELAEATILITKYETQEGMEAEEPEDWRGKYEELAKSNMDLQINHVHNLSECHYSKVIIGNVVTSLTQINDELQVLVN